MAISAKHFALAITLMFSGMIYAQAIASQKVTVNGETQLSLDAATVSIRTREVSAPKGLNASENRLSPCTGGRVPCLLTVSFQIRVNGKSIYIPYSAVADLADMSSVRLQHIADNYLLTIQGGDASESYIAKLSFDRIRVIERVVAPGEDSTQPSERTTYYNPKRVE